MLIYYFFLGTSSLPSVPVKDLSKYNGLPQFAPNATFKGTLTLAFPFSLKLNTLTSEGKMEGEIFWPTENAKSKVEGEIKGNEFTLDENASMFISTGRVL